MFRTAFRVSAFAAYLLAFSCLDAQVRQSGTNSVLHAGMQQADDTTKKSSGDKKEKDNDKPLSKEEIRNPVLWQQRDNIAGLDLAHGQGGEAHQPVPPFSFLEESMHGTNPKFDARDADGKKWRVKLGEEARPEVVASRLLWAVGYFTEDDYLLAETEVPGLKLKRGGRWAQADRITNARFARKPGGQKKIGIWAWKDNPFYGTREFNGLRVMMAVLNNWDLKDVNNSVFFDDKNDRQVFLVSDIGATFATNTITTHRSIDKGNVDSYKESKFITKTTDKEVDFGTPAPPTGLLLKSGFVLAKDFMRRKGYDWIGDNIPREDARWMGSLLGQLSHQQLMDAFNAGNFPPDQVALYVSIVESRVQELKAL